MVPASSPAAQYIYTFSGNVVFQFGATGLITPGSYNYYEPNNPSRTLPFPDGTISPAGGFATLTLSSSGEWSIAETGSATCSLSTVLVNWVLTPGVPQVPVPGTNVVYNKITYTTVAGQCPLLQPPVTTTLPGSATLTISQAPPTSVPAPGTLLLLLCGLAGLGFVGAKLRTA